MRQVSELCKACKTAIHAPSELGRDLSGDGARVTIQIRDDDVVANVVKLIARGLRQKNAGLNFIETDFVRLSSAEGCKVIRLRRANSSAWLKYGPSRT